MSDEARDNLYHHDHPYHSDHRYIRASGTSFASSSDQYPLIINLTSPPRAADYYSSASYHHNLQLDGFDDPSSRYMMSLFTQRLHGSSTDYSALERVFNVPPPCLSSEVFICSVDGSGEKKSSGTPTGDSSISVGAGGSGDNINPVTPNSSVSSSSTEAAAAEEDSMKITSKKQDLQLKGCDEYGSGSSNKLKRQRKSSSSSGTKKRIREPRFAFMTKSEIDNLEDGYRWRKYGQKAVKNSPYPRSYYRCTSQKCTVKKRVERSFQDPSMVITTYEGQHNHHTLATHRGNAAGHHRLMLLPAASISLTSPVLVPPPSSFPLQELLIHHHQIPHPINNNQQQQITVTNYTTNSSMVNINPQNLDSSSTTTLHHQQLQLIPPDYGLLQDIVPSFIHNQQQQP